LFFKNIPAINTNKTKSNNYNYLLQYHPNFIGKSVIRLPVILLTALPIAAPIGPNGGSRLF